MTGEQAVRFTVVLHEDESERVAAAKAGKEWDRRYREELAASGGKKGRKPVLRYVGGSPQSAGSQFIVHTYEGTLLDT